METLNNMDREHALVAVRRVAECRVQQTVDSYGRVIEWGDEGRLLEALRDAVIYMHDVVGARIAISKRIEVDGVKFDVYPNGSVVAGVTV